jgi:hypothetical protein
MFDYPNPQGARNATLHDLTVLLRDQQARKLDVVAPATAVHADAGRLVITGAEAVLTDDGVTAADGIYLPTVVCDEGIADKLAIPLAYLRRLRTERIDLYDGNVNGWLHGRTPGTCVNAITGEHEQTRAGADPDSRSFLVRCFRADDQREGIARAFLSDRYAVIDHLDVLTAALDGVRQARVGVEIAGCDLSERRMAVRIAAPEVAALAPELLAGYRSPFTGASGADNPTVFAGFVLSNSETGGGAFSIVPRMIVQVCANGMTLTKDAMRAVHLGARLDDGPISWSADTQRRNLDLITAKCADAVTAFLSAGYLQSSLTALQQHAGTRISKPAETIQQVGKKVGFTDAEISGVLEHFILGGSLTTGGVLHAVSSYAQTVPDPDDAYALESIAVKAMELAAA